MAEFLRFQTFHFFFKAQNVYIESVILFYEYLLDPAKTKHSSFTLLTKFLLWNFSGF